MKQTPYTGKYKQNNKENSSQSLGKQWEQNVYAGISDYLDTQQNGYVHHLIPRIFHGRVSEPQIMDILVQNAGTQGRDYAIECKSSYDPKAGAYTSSWFNGRVSESVQYEKESEYIRRSASIGVIAFRMPLMDGKKCAAYLIPWNAIPMIDGHKITPEILDNLVVEGFVYQIPTTNGTVRFDDDDVFGELAQMDERAGSINSRQ